MLDDGLPASRMFLQLQLLVRLRFFFDEDRHEIGVIPEKREPRKGREESFRCQTGEGVSTGRMSYTAAGPPSGDLRCPPPQIRENVHPRLRNKH